MKTILLTTFVLFFFLIPYANGQNQAFFQGFEGTSSDNWGYTNPTQNLAASSVSVGAANYGAGYAKTGTQSMRAAGGSASCGSGSGNCIVGTGSGGSCNSMNGQIVTFNTIDISCLTTAVLSVSHRCHALCSGQGQGFDSGENLQFQVNLNNGGWTTVGTVGGASNYTWSYSTNPAGSSSSAGNPFVYNVPAGTTSFAFRTLSNTNRSDEVYYIDDVSLTTSSVVPFPSTDPCDVPNPVTLLNFNAKRDDHNIIFNWSTASELNNDYFFIEYSENGIDYTELLIINGSGTSNIMHTYQAMTSDWYDNTVYFRLKQYDYDGKVTTYPAVTLYSEEHQERFFISYSDNQIYANLYTPVETTATILIYSILGNTVIEEATLALTEGTYQIPLSPMAVGMYICSVTINEKNYNQKIIQR